ncbi:major facilitator superfamily domain-containing protein [Kockovaella imperatae]|uniref:Major facilitator superfamily domain-containing protein n=1 Tax=Kockovaella imperatae TaxID=4999 RepID=A0A1Y1UR65_9TREE|nr:major facilitator superfamily domain-containing protein [Kockovaella imperatae]ORX39926.1 major facilitator superfamily domain-containing protein [Kockovaella imperatae]
MARFSHQLKIQVAILILTRLAEPITYTVIFPFINQMCLELGVTDNSDKVGFYSGLVESTFAFVQFFTVYHWAKLSDRIGRKPVILLGLTGVAISGTLFGLSTRFWMMIAARAISGALNGNVAVIKASLGDITDESNSTEAFALYGLTWTVGSMIGNSIGGTLSHPFERFPSVFGGFPIFKHFPYLFPCLVCTFMTLLGLLFGTFCYRETLPGPTGSMFSMRVFSPTHKRHSSSSTSVSDTETLVGDDTPSTEMLLAKMPQGVDGPGLAVLEPQRWGFRSLMGYRPVQILSLTMFLNSFVNGAWSAASLLFFFDRNNGLNMSAAAIGSALALNGFWSIACQLLFLTRIRRYFGLATAYKLLTFGWILVWVLLPLLRPILVAVETPVPNEAGSLAYAEERSWTVTICVNLLLSYVTFCGMTSSLLMVLINFSAPDRTALGAVNGIATAVGCMSRVIGPSLISALFAISVDRGILGGRLWWVFMLFASAVNFICCLFVQPDAPSPAIFTKGDDES